MTDGGSAVGYTVGNGKILFHRDSDGSIGIGNYGKKLITMKCRDGGLSLSAECDGAVFTARYTSGEPVRTSDVIKAECVFRVYADEDDGFIVASAACMFDMFFDLGFCGTVTEPFGDGSRMITDVGSSLLILTDGNVTANGDVSTLHFSLTYSKLLIYSGEVTEEKYRFLSKILRGITVPDRRAEKPKDAVYRSSAYRLGRCYAERKPADAYPYPLSELLSHLRSEIYNSVSESGGIFCGEGSTLSEMTEAFRFAVCDRNRMAADGFVRFLSNIVGRYGDVPYSVRADGSEPEFIPGLHCVGFDLAVVGLCEYARTFHKVNDGDVLSLIKKILKRGSLLEKRGMMPFSGFEKEISPGMRFCGSYFSSAGFLIAVNEYISLLKQVGYEEKRLVSTASLIRERLAENFVKDGSVVYASEERLAAVRYPKSIYGRCDVCGNGSVLYRRTGKYLCPDCLSDGKRKVSADGTGEWENPVYALCRLSGEFRITDEHWLVKYAKGEPKSFDEYIGAAIYHKRSAEKCREYLLTAYGLLASGKEKKTASKQYALCTAMMKYCKKP